MKKLTVVYLWDGAAAYVNGELVCDHFTRGHVDLLNALGIDKSETVIACPNHYRDNNFPAKLKDVVIDKENN